MTEVEWVGCKDPAEMLIRLGAKGSMRKWRLAACAICRDAWHLLSDGRSRAAVEILEKAADGDASWHDGIKIAFNGSAHAANDAIRGVAEGIPGVEQRHADASSAAHTAARLATGGANTGEFWSLFRSVAQATDGETSFYRQADMLRDVFGYPFRPVTVNSSWLTSDARTLAVIIYQERAFDRMPILADALQDAGCDSAEVLDHCRGPGPHVRGCWVVDLVLGKE